MANRTLAASYTIAFQKIYINLLEKRITHPEAEKQAQEVYRQSSHPHNDFSTNQLRIDDILFKLGIVLNKEDLADVYGDSPYYRLGPALASFKKKVVTLYKSVSKADLIKLGKSDEYKYTVSECIKIHTQLFLKNLDVTELR